MRSVSWYRRKYSSYFLRLVCFSSARVISGDGVAFSPDGASHDPTSPDDASHDPSSGGASAPAWVPSSDGFATGSAPGACHIPSLSSPAAAGPPGASSLSARSAAMRCGGRCGCRWSDEEPDEGSVDRVTSRRSRTTAAGKEIEARRRGGSWTDAHLGVQSGSRARSERVDRADLGAQHRQQETRERREPHRRRSSRVPSQWVEREARVGGPMSTSSGKKKIGAPAGAVEPRTCPRRVW